MNEVPTTSYLRTNDGNQSIVVGEQFRIVDSRAPADPPLPPNLLQSSGFAQPLTTNYLLGM